MGHYLASGSFRTWNSHRIFSFLETQEYFYWSIQHVCVLLLWFYSTTFKKKLLIGNVLISILTAWVIGVLYLCEFRLHRFVDPEFHGALSQGL